MPPRPNPNLLTQKDIDNLVHFTNKVIEHASFSELKADDILKFSGLIVSMQDLKRKLDYTLNNLNNTEG